MESKMIFSIARRFRHFNVGIWIVLKKERKNTYTFAQRFGKLGFGFSKGKNTQ